MIKGMLIQMKKWVLKTKGNTKTTNMHQLHYIIILQCFNPQRMVYLESAVKKSAPISSSCYEEVFPNVTKCIISFNLNIFGNYASMNPDPKFVVKMMSQKHSCINKDAQEKGYFICISTINVYSAMRAMSYGNHPEEN